MGAAYTSEGHGLHEYDISDTALAQLLGSKRAKAPLPLGGGSKMKQHGATHVPKKPSIKPLNCLIYSTLYLLTNIPINFGRHFGVIDCNIPYKNWLLLQNTLQILQPLL